MVPWPRLKVKSDQEPAIVSLRTAAARIAHSATGTDMMMEDSQSVKLKQMALLSR